MATSSDISSFFSDDTPSSSKIGGSCDLLTEILSRVPARSLFRFKCVSQHWRSLISHDRRFALLHATRNPIGACSGLFSSSTKERKCDFYWLNRLAPPPPPLSFLQSLSTSRILQSSNGLLLCSSSISDCAYFVCNPVLSRFCRLDLPGRELNLKVLGLTLAFDPSLWTGFKVICFFTTAIEVYSSDTNNWKRLVQGPIKQLNLEFEDGVYCKGKAFWLRKQSSFDPPVYRVLNLENDSFDERGLPCSSYSMVRYFGESNGHLHLVTKERESFNLFEMGEDQDWMLKFKVMESVMRRHLTVGYLDLSNSIWGGSWLLNVVRKPEDGGGYLLMWYLPYGTGRVFSYDCETMVVNCLAESKTPGKIFQFIESLFWI